MMVFAGKGLIFPRRASGQASGRLHKIKGLNDFIKEESAENTYLKEFYYEYFLHRVGAAPFTGYGASIKKGASDERIDGMAYRVYSCGVYKDGVRTELIVPLEALIVVQN